MAAQNVEPLSINALVAKVENRTGQDCPKSNRLPPLFVSEMEYHVFCARHEKATILTGDIKTYRLLLMKI